MTLLAAASFGDLAVLAAGTLIWPLSVMAALGILNRPHRQGVSHSNLRGSTFSNRRDFRGKIDSLVTRGRTGSLEYS